MSLHNQNVHQFVNFYNDFPVEVRKRVTRNIIAQFTSLQIQDCYPFSNYILALCQINPRVYLAPSTAMYCILPAEGLELVGVLELL